MKLQLGANLRALRRQREITQEELADILGVSYQSVSRWENNTCYPDMELLPTLAEFFGVTIDHLLGVDAATEQHKVTEYLNRFQDAISQGNVDACIAVAREGVREFPNSYTLLNKLMYALFISGDSDGNVTEWNENMEAYDAEITSLGERIMKYCPDQCIQLEAMVRLAFNHCEMGRVKEARAIYNALPPMEYSREIHIIHALSPDEKLSGIRQMILGGFSILRGGLYTLAYERILPDEELVHIFEKIFALDSLIYDDTADSPYRFTAQVRCIYAAALARLGRKEEAVNQLRIAAERALAFDKRPEYAKSACLLLGEKEWHRSEFETSDNRSCCEIMLNKWLSTPDFDELRTAPEYQNILKSLQ